MESAVIVAGGKQYRVQAGDVVDLELIANAQAGENCVFDQVLMLEKDGNIQVGTPNLSQVSINATVLENIRGDKIRVFKMRRRKKSRRTQGHRQYLSRVRIDTINS